MRTTLNIEDELFSVIRAIAESTSQPIGKVASDLIRKGLGQRETVGRRNGLPVFEVGESPSVITIEDVKRDDDGA